MRQWLRSFQGWLLFFGFDPMRLVRTLLELPRFVGDLVRFKRQVLKKSPLQLGRIRPMLLDRSESSGRIDAHYFFQDLCVARRIFLANPVRHLDVGSRLDGFIAHVAVFRPIEVIDIRPQEITFDNIILRQADLMELPADLIQCCDSLSSLHAIEHFGLGRYSDPIDANGHEKAIANIARILKPDGTFYLSVPIGPSRIEFNSHRVFSLDHLLSALSGPFHLERFSYVDDQGRFHEDVDLTAVRIASNCECTYGCGILELRRLADPPIQ